MLDLGRLLSWACPCRSYRPDRIPIAGPEGGVARIARFFGHGVSGRSMAARVER